MKPNTDQLDSILLKTWAANFLAQPSGEVQVQVACNFRFR